MRAPLSKLWSAATVAVVVLVIAALPGFGASDFRKGTEKLLKDAAEGSFDVLEIANQYAEARTAPAESAPAAALIAAQEQRATLPTGGGAWAQVTNKPYQNDSALYRDPFWSNSGAGWGLVAGRMTALAVDGTAVYAGAADGGVWKTTNGGATWSPKLDDTASISIGALAVNPDDHSVWVGTGEANTSSDSYKGIGVLRSTDGGNTWAQVGGDELQDHLIVRLAFDGQGNVYAATAYGLYRHSSADASGAWELLLKPCLGQHDTTYISDVAIRPGTNGQEVVAIVGWRGGSACNGFYLSTDGGDTFNPITLSGAINDGQIGRTTLAYSTDGGKLYAVVESSKLFNHPSAHQGGTNLMGVFVSPSGDPAGSWNRIATSGQLAASGSALQSSRGYEPGVQSWYNQFILVDPGDDNHVYLGLEEVFETLDGGASWNAIGPYWNFPFDCYQVDPDSCPGTTHPDQHAVAIAGGTVIVGNDGGVYARKLHNATGWLNTNATLRNLQYYFAETGRNPTGGGTALWGGLQDNGVSLLYSGAPQMVSPFGGDGGDGIVDPNNSDRSVQEYVSLNMALTTNGGRSDGSTRSWITISPSCFSQEEVASPCDPNPRFIAPFESDSQDLDHWVAGGEFVWDNEGKGWDTRCDADACDWKIVYDTGPGHSVTALGVNGDVTYAGWCGPCNPPGFASGIATNLGGTWHEVESPVPTRFVNALTVDPADAAHVYAVYNGYSRRWIPNAGTGHIFESTDGGETWNDISGNLPDIPSDDVLLINGKLVLGTDSGVYVANAGEGAATTWSNFGTGLPNASVNDLLTNPAGTRVLAATHGRAIWQIPAP
ncbi:MAG TPA: glycosyl hydrolase [Actinomycetota bacterium]|nr:glycosyl hydrolase [Actinomycetota bacterium]